MLSGGQVGCVYAGTGKPSGLPVGNADVTTDSERKNIIWIDRNLSQKSIPDGKMAELCMHFFGQVLA